MSLDSHEHVFIPGNYGAPVLLTLHGTGGNERSLLGLAAELAPGFHILSPRGNVLEHGMPRFFKRHAEGIFDLEDLAARTDELAAFLRAALQKYDISDAPVWAVGYSNGANVAANMLLRHPDVLSGAVLFRAMFPAEPEQEPDLTGAQVLLLNGVLDTMIPKESADHLAKRLRETGAAMEHRWLPASHQLTHEDVETARQFLAP